MILRQGETQEEFYARKLRALHSISDHRTLIIVDNFDVETDPDFDSFVSGSHHIIFTTRNHHSGHKSISVSAICDESIAFQIFNENYGRAIAAEDRPFLQKLFSLIEYHTYAIELLAKQMAAEFCSGKELLEMFTSGHFLKGKGEKIFDSEGSDTAFGYLCQLFSMSKLNAEEHQILIELSLAGIGGVPEANFWKWTQVANPKQVVNGLIRKSWVRCETGNGVGRLSLHSLVCEVIRTMEKTRPSVDRCRAFLEKIGDDLYGAWYIPVGKNLAIVDCVLSIAEYFAPFEFDKDDKDLLEIWAYIPSFLWQIGRFDESIRIGRIVFDSCYHVCGEQSMLTGYAARNLAGCYFNSGNFEESIPWYKKGLEYMLASGQEICEDLAISYEKVARCYTWESNQDFTLAQQYFDRALCIRKKLIRGFVTSDQCYTVEKRRKQSPEVFEEGVGLIYLEMGRMHQIKGDYTLALEYAEKCREILEHAHPDNISNLAYTYLDKGVCYYYLGLEKQRDGNKTASVELLKKAEHYLTKAFDINKRMRGGVAIDTLTNQEYLGDVYAALKDYKQAMLEYTSVVSMMKVLLGQQHLKYKKIVEKINGIKELILE